MSKRREPNRTLEEELSNAVGKTNTRNTVALLDRGANPEYTYNEHPIPFKATFLNLRLLLDRGVNVDLTNHEGKTILNYDCYRHSSQNIKLNKTNHIRLLLSRGADPNLADHRGETPLHSLCQTSMDTDLLRLLLEHHANVNQQDNEGKTVFHHIATNYSYPALPYHEAIELLLKAGGNPLIRNEEGQAASEMARDAHLLPLARELEEAERQANSENRNQTVNGGRRRSVRRPVRKSTRKARGRRNKRTHKAQSPH